MLARPVTPSAKENREAVRRARAAASQDERDLLAALTKIHDEEVVPTLLSTEAFDARRDAEARHPLGLSPQFCADIRARLQSSLSSSKAPESDEPTLEEAA